MIIRRKKRSNKMTERKEKGLSTLPTYLIRKTSLLFIILQASKNIWKFLQVILGVYIQIC